MNSVTPAQMLKVGLGDEGISVPLFRLPFLGGRDGFARPGGFYVTKDGEFGVAIDAGLSPEDAQPFVAEELRKNASFIAAALASQVDITKKVSGEKVEPKKLVDQSDAGEKIVAPSSLS